MSQYDACLYSVVLPPPPDPRGLAAFLGGTVAFALSSCLPPWLPSQHGGGSAWGFAAARHKRDDDDGSGGALEAAAAEEELVAQDGVPAPPSQPWRAAAARTPLWLRSLFARS